MRAFLTGDALQAKNCRHSVEIQELGAIHIERFFIVMEQIQKQTTTHVTIDV